MSKGNPSSHRKSLVEMQDIFSKRINSPPFYANGFSMQLQRRIRVRYKCTLLKLYKYTKKLRTIVRIRLYRITENDVVSISLELRKSSLQNDISFVHHIIIYTYCTHSVQTIWKRDKNSF